MAFEIIKLTYLLTYLQEWCPNTPRCTETTNCRAVADGAITWYGTTACNGSIVRFKGVRNDKLCVSNADMPVAQLSNFWRRRIGTFLKAHTHTADQNLTGCCACVSHIRYSQIRQPTSQRRQPLYSGGHSGTADQGGHDTLCLGEWNYRYCQLREYGGRVPNILSQAQGYTHLEIPLKSSLFNLCSLLCGQDRQEWRF